MNERGVHPHEMNSNNLTDDKVEALIAGNGYDHDPQLAGLLASVRAAYTSNPLTVGAELAAVLTLAVTAADESPAARRVQRLRSSVIAKLGAATTAVLVATGGLAVANALPAPVQDAISHLGLGAASDAHHDALQLSSPTPTTAFTTSREAGDAHGKAVSTVARNHASPCVHGANVSRVASAQRTHNPHRTCRTSNAISNKKTTAGVHHGPPNTPPPASARSNRAHDGHTAKSPPNAK
jgi:hypothetical protein